MTTTYSTDAQCYQTSTIARAALVAYSDAVVAAGGTSVSTLDVFRVEAQRQILARLRQKGIDQSGISRSVELQTVEAALTLALLFEAVQQWSRDGTEDVYARNGKYWRERYEQEYTLAAPVDGVRHTGSSFSWDRG